MPLLYFLAPLGAVLIWSGNMTINQLTVGSIAPSSIAFLRWVLALLVLTPFVLPAALKHRGAIRRQWYKLAFLGLLGMAMWQGPAYVAAQTTSAARSKTLGQLPGNKALHWRRPACCASSGASSPTCTGLPSSQMTM